MKDALIEARRWWLQRMSAMVLAVCVLAHLALIVYATRQGITAEHILGRTRGSWSFGLFYGTFVVACAVHVPIGLSAIAREWLGWSKKFSWNAARVFGLIILVMGGRAVVAVIFP
ncbi:MAG TPA: succinate dehydrogenase [Ramlibacter sp.]|nr:succinate dehydrogenase [Ramlibacter sp.]